jgi:hypothetical protein
MKPKVYSEASLIYGSWWVAFVQRMLISSSHSPLGISIAAMADTKLAIYDRTRVDGLARLARTASFMLCLKKGSTEIQRSAYLESPERFEIKFLQITLPIIRVYSLLESSLISLIKEARNFF